MEKRTNFYLNKFKHYSNQLPTVTWGMCNLVMTCFITSIGHGEPAIIPERKKIAIYFFIPVNILKVVKLLRKVIRLTEGKLEQSRMISYAYLYKDYLCQIS